MSTDLRKSTPFRFLQKLPIKLMFSETKPTPIISELQDEEGRNLVERTHILKCDYKEDHEDLESEEEEKEEYKPKDYKKDCDIYGDVNNRTPNEFEEISHLTACTVVIAWGVLFVYANFLAICAWIGILPIGSTNENKKMKKFVPLYNDFDAFYQRKCYMNIRDVFERPICSTPGETVDLVDRVSHDGNWTYEYPGTKTNVINVSSYNYLGFAQSSGPCAEASAQAIDREGIACCTTVHESGRSATQQKLEKLVAEFLGVDDAICFSMGFATNSMNAPCLVDSNSLIISDKLNHVSLVLGAIMSGAKKEIFQHNNMESLENILRDAIAYGNPKTNRPYNKILIVVEGIYSMEGSICNLPEIIALKKKYKAYLYLDEAHSIGAMGKTGKGVVEYWGCDPKDVDILMGTFTKSFGSSGGYIAGSKRTIDHLRVTSPTGYYSSPMSPPIAQQIYTAMNIIMGRDGTNNGAERIERLARNSHYFRMKLKQMGFIVYGSNDSPVVPMMFYYPVFVGYYGREMLKRKIGCVVVSYPACSMTEGRVRFCISAAHSKEQLDEVLDAVNEIGSKSRSKFSRKTHLYKYQKIEW